MSTEQGRYWDGALWIYQADITNDGINSGNHIYELIPGDGNELQILYGAIFNGDGVARNAQLDILSGSGGETIFEMMENPAIAASGYETFPKNSTVTESNAPTGGRVIIAGNMGFKAQLASVATSNDSAFSIGCRIRGGVPSVTLTSPTDAVEVVNISQVY